MEIVSDNKKNNYNFVKNTNYYFNYHIKKIKNDRWVYKETLNFSRT